jgi:osmotically inducible protein OsmC
MAKIERQATAQWEGNLTQGHGKIVSVTSGTIEELPITWQARTERSNGKTSPEELIAAAHAGCYAMAFSHTLATAGTPAKKLSVNAISTLEQVDGKFKLTTIELDVRGKVPELDQAGFEKAALQAEQGCPVSNALRNNVQIRVKALLEQ